MQPLDQALKSNNPLTVSTCARSFKYSAHNNKDPKSMKNFVGALVSLIRSNDLMIKKNSLESLGQIVFNIHLKELLTDLVDQVVELTLLETPIKKELIITVDLGPFKHTVDNGAPIRKAAFSLLENLCERYSFNQSSIVDAVINGFQDSSEDVQVLCLSFMNKLLNICPMTVISKLDTIVEQFTKIYQKNSNNLKKDGQAERALNLMRGVLRVAEALNRNSEAVANINF